MGGKKKPTISSLERKMRKMREKEREKKRRGREEKMKLVKTTDINNIVREIKGLKYITPFLMYQKYGIKISEAKRMLRKFHEEGILTLYSGGRRVPIYIPKSS